MNRGRVERKFARYSNDVDELHCGLAIDTEVRRPHRLLFLCLGWFSFVLGIIGLALPVVPTSPFIILAAWAFSKSSPRFERWLVHHKYLGPPVRRWRAYRVVPLQAKLISLSAMSITMLGSILSGRIPWWVLVLEGLLMGGGGWFILRCPSRPPPGAPATPDA